MCEKITMFVQLLHILTLSFIKEVIYSSWIIIIKKKKHHRTLEKGTVSKSATETSAKVPHQSPLLISTWCWREWLIAVSIYMALK